jgi:Zn-dependent protease/CBS domain-containing protein
MLTATFPFFRISGVEVRLHFTFVILIALLVLSTRPEAWTHLLLATGIFASVLLHEFAHAHVARRFQIRTLDIIMYFLGGVARLERQPGLREDLLIAAAGPLANLLLAAAFHFLHAANPTVSHLADLRQANLLLALFNLLPALPLDGGRILRCLLSFRMPELRAARLTGISGQVIALSLAAFSLWQAQWLFLAASGFLFLTARKEYETQRSAVLMSGARLREVMIERFETLDHGATLRQAAETLLTSAQQDFPVLHGSQVVGLLTRDELVEALSQRGPDAYVAGAMDRDFLALAPEDSLPANFPLLAQNDFRALILSEDRLLGILTLDKINEFLVLRSVGLRREIP